MSKLLPISHKDAVLELVTFDTETRGFKQGLRCITWTHKENGKLQTYFTEKPEEFFDWVFDHESPDNRLILMAHNLTFDIRHLDQAYRDLYHQPMMNLTHQRTIIQHGKAYRVPMMNYNVEFKDSLRILPDSLDRLSKDFNVSHKKLDMHETAHNLGYATVAEYLAEAPIDKMYMRYAMTDTIALYEIFEQYAEYIHEVYPESNLGTIWQVLLNKPTSPSVAMSLFGAFHPKDYMRYAGLLEYKDKNGQIKKRATKLTGKVLKLVKSAIHGGRTEKFRDSLQAGYVYDINSLYPYVMKSFLYPVFRGQYSDETSGAKVVFNQVIHDKREYLGIVHGMVYAPMMEIPVLGVSRQGKYIFPVGNFEWTGTLSELRYAMQYGYEMREVLELVYWPQKAYVYEEYINHWSAAKEKAGREGNKGKRVICKNMQNHLFGKSIQDQTIRRYVTEVLEGKTEIGESFEYVDETYHQIEAKSYTDYYQPQVGAHVTSYARITLHKAMMAQIENGGIVAYCDTDSIITDKAFPDHLVDSERLGLWKEEKRFSEAIFVLPKLYALQTEEEITRKGRGYSRETMEKMTMKDYSAMLDALRKGESMTIEQVEKPSTLTEYLKTGEFSMIRTKRLSGNAREKRVFDRETGLSSPIILDEVLTSIEQSSIIETETEEIEAEQQKKMDDVLTFLQTLN